MNHRKQVHWLLLIVGVLLLANGLWGLTAGQVVSTWARLEYRPSVPYWITVTACLGGGVSSLVLAVRVRSR